MRILVIDDSPTDQNLIGAVLTQGGHHPVCASSCTQGLALLEDPANAIDLILLDRMMPDIDGLETARLIRDLERRHQQPWRPIVFLSGRNTTADIAEGVDAGADDYLTKPIDARLLMAKLQAMQRIVQMRQQLLKAQQALQQQANHDHLTDLPNRRFFLQRLEQESARAQRHRSTLCLAYLDLDHFKQINDRHGHAIGDAVLRATSTLLSGSIRREDILGRLGGEEFCLCMPQISLEAAQHACERYCELLSQMSIPGCDEALQVTVSIGLTLYNPLLDSPQTLLERADSALYQAKTLGRNRVEVIAYSNADRSHNRVQLHSSF